MNKVTQLTLVSRKTNVISTSEFVKEIIIVVQLKLLIGAAVMLIAAWQSLRICS